MPSGRPRVLVVLGLAIVVAASLLLRPRAVVGHVQSVLNSPWFPVVLVGLYLGRPFLGWPITVLSALVGYRYGILYGVPIAVLGAVVSTFVPFVAMEYFEFESGLLGWVAGESRDFFSETGGLRGVVAARVAPVPAEAVSLAAGAADVRPRTYVLGTAVGELPWAVAAVTVGHSMYRLTLDDVTFSPWLLAATTVAALVVLAGPAYRFLQRLTRDGPADVAPGESRLRD